MMAAHGPRARPAWATSNSIDLGSSPAQLAESFSRILPEHSCCCWSSAAQCSGACRLIEARLPTSRANQHTRIHHASRCLGRDPCARLGSNLSASPRPMHAPVASHLPLAPMLPRCSATSVPPRRQALRGTCFKHWMSDLRARAKRARAARSAHGVHGVGRGACPARQIRPFWPLSLKKVFAPSLNPRRGRWC